MMRGMKPNSKNQAFVTKSCGFTLIEMLMALVIMSVISVLAYGAFDGVLQMENRSKEDFLKENRRNLASSIMINDLFHLRPRPVRDEWGGVTPAYKALAYDASREKSISYQVQFTRGGLPDFDTMRGGLQRVAYRVEGGSLIRTVWDVLDRTPNSQSIDHVLASGIKSLRVEQVNNRGEFEASWPPANENLALEALPSLIRLTLIRINGEEEKVLIPGPDGYLGRYVSNSGDRHDT